MERRFRTGRHERGFTVAELLVVLVVIGLLAAIAVPNVTGAIRRAEEAALRENLQVMRGAIDDYFADKGRYPQSLDDLVADKYLRAIPDDPVADGAVGWRVVQTITGIEDVRSGSNEIGSNEVPYAEW